MFQQPEMVLVMLLLIVALLISNYEVSDKKIRRND